MIRQPSLRLEISNLPKQNRDDPTTSRGISIKKNLMWLSAIFVRFVQSFFFSIIWKRLKKTQSLLFEFCKVSVKIVVVLFVVVRVVHRDRQWNIFIFDARGSLSTPT